MLKPFSFVHAADLHLGSPFKGVGSKLPAVAEKLGAATYEAFFGLIDLCIEKKVDFLLVAGDVFDLPDRSLRAQLAFRDGIARLSDSGIQSFTVLGNHDPWETWASRISWPEGAHVFSPDQVETVPVVVGGTPVAAVSGISYRTQRQTEDLSVHFHPGHPELYQVALLHSNCGSHPDHGAYAPSSLSSLRNAGFDYWALGHVHEKKILETHPYIVYPGCTQGLSIREAGAHGCWLVSVDAHRKAALSFHPLDQVRWRSVTIDISGLDRLDALDQSITETLSRCAEEADGRPAILRILFNGRGDLYKPLRQPAVTEDLLERSREFGVLQSPSVWVQDLAVNCRPEIDMDQRANMDDLLGQVLQNAAGLGRSSATLPEHLMPILSELYRHARLARYLETPSPAELLALLQDAALICFDHLESDL
jgi:DNA repair exonuclease SbcCD nuclease subunit